MRQPHSGSFARCSAMFLADFSANLGGPASSNDFQPGRPHRTSTRSTAGYCVPEDAATLEGRLEKQTQRMLLLLTTQYLLQALRRPLRSPGQLGGGADTEPPETLPDPGALDPPPPAGPGMPIELRPGVMPRAPRVALARPRAALAWPKAALAAAAAFTGTVPRV